MHRCNGLHCDGCRHGGRAGLGLGVLLVLAGVLVYAAHHRAIDHAASATAHVLVDVLAITAITLTVATVAAGTVWAVRTRQRTRHRATVSPSVRVIRPCAAPARPSVEPPQVVLRALPDGRRDTLPTAVAMFLDACTREEQGR
jgi:hypothetical protein